MTAHAVENDKPVHRSFRLTRPTRGPENQQVSPALVLPERDIRAIAAAAAHEDVAQGGCYSAGPAGIQIWSTSWDGALGGRGASVHLGSVDWSYDTPVTQYATIYRVLVTREGLEAGETTTSILNRALQLGGLTTPTMNEGRQQVPPPRDPFRSSALRRRSELG